MFSSISELLELFNHRYVLEEIDYRQKCSESHDLDKYKVLKLIDEYHNVDLAFAMADNLKSPQTQLMELLIDEGYVTCDITSETWQDFAGDLTVNELKEILRDNGLKVSGRKQELIDRIGESEIHFNKFSCDKSFLTQKGKNYITEYSWIGLYINFLSSFEFADFYRFYGDCDDDFFDVVSRYLDEHIKLANTYKDFNYIIDCFSSKAIFCEINDNLEEALTWEMRKFCLAINPIYLDKEYYAFYLPLNNENIDNLRLLRDEFSHEKIMMSFDKSWDSFKFSKFIVSRENAKAILERVLIQNDDLESVIWELKEKYFGRNVFDNTHQTDLNDYFK